MLYFDCAASTRPYPEALAAFLEASSSCFGNPSSRHEVGYSAEKLVERSRESMLSALGLGATHRLVFCSGATEANNLALKGTALSYRNRGRKILTSPLEHPSVLNALKALARDEGFEVSFLALREDGKVDLDDLRAKLDPSVVLVSCMAVNNETGIVQPIAEIGKIVKTSRKAFFHCDATQAIGKIPLALSDVDLLTFSAHKFGGVKGVGALVCKKTMRLLPQLDGGEQEYGLRAGTIDAPSIAAMEAAFKKSVREQKENLAKVSALAAYLREGLGKIAEVRVISPLDASPYVLDFALLSHKASVVVEALSERGIYVSSVSACSSKSTSSSYVLAALGYPPRLAENPIRVSMPVETTREEIDFFLASLTAILKETFPL